MGGEGTAVTGRQEIENILDRLTTKLMPPGRTTLQERAAVRSELQRLSDAILATAQAEADSR